VGMKLPGIVTNITNFGAFVDIGVHQDGLVHTSQLANRFVSNPNDVVKVHQKVEVTVTEVDVARKRISLSMRTEQAPQAKAPKSKEQPKVHKKPTEQKGKERAQPAKAAPKAKQAEGDLQVKLEALKNMFKK